MEWFRVGLGIAIILLILEMVPKQGGWLLIVIVLGMLLVAVQKGTL